MNSPVVVELEHAHATDAAVVRAIGFDNLAAVTEAVGSRVCAIDNWQVMGDHLQDLLLLLLAGRLGQLLQVGQGNAKLKGVEGNGNTGLLSTNFKSLRDESQGQGGKWGVTFLGTTPI